MSFLESKRAGIIVCIVVCVLFRWEPAISQTQGSSAFPMPQPAAANILNSGQWVAINQSLERALAWLSQQQAADGSFISTDSGQPAITSLCVMAFLAAGHLPSEKIYGPK